MIIDNLIFIKTLFLFSFFTDLFIQAKLWNSNHRPEHVEIDLDATLKDLQLDYIDSYVILYLDILGGVTIILIYHFFPFLS